MFFPDQLPIGDLAGRFQRAGGLMLCNQYRFVSLGISKRTFWQHRQLGQLLPDVSRTMR